MKKTAAIPHDTTAESYVLGSLMLHSDIIDEWDELNAEYFFLPAHQSILAAITTIRAGGGMPDLLTVTQRLDERGELERVGGPGVLTEMYSHGGGRDPQLPCRHPPRLHGPPSHLGTPPAACPSPPKTQPSMSRRSWPKPARAS
jgi:hypothetical protein